MGWTNLGARLDGAAGGLRGREGRPAIRVYTVNSNIHAGGFLGDVKPDVVKIGFGPRR